MNQKTLSTSLIVNRLTALWALNECGLGGFLHALSSPFTGIVVGGLSVLFITMIATYADNIKASILKALFIVLLVKLSVSPHSPFAAYMAVSFQAFLGLFLFSLFSVNKATIIALGTLTFLESALQKLITLTIIYGQTLWEAIDSYTSWVSLKFDFIPTGFSSKHLVIAFLIFYALSGLIVGVLIIKIVHLIKRLDTTFNPNLNLALNPLTTNEIKEKALYKNLLFWGILLVFILTPLYFFANDDTGWKTAVYLISRSAFIIGLWYIVIGPLFMRLLKNMLRTKKSLYQSELQETLLLLPHLRSIIAYTWGECKQLKGIKKLKFFLAKSIIYSFYYNPSH